VHLARYCLRCAGDLVDRIPPDDTRLRRVCVLCGYVSYMNPKLAAGTVPWHDGRIALIRRGIEPGLGLWSWPSGYVEVDETVEAAAVRETREETALAVTLGPFLGIYSFPALGQDPLREPAGVVVVGWLAQVDDGELLAGDDAAEAQWFAPEDIPWDQLAFASSRLGLEHAFAHQGMERDRSA
jgi:ADP-ribose pyrophosphatase YjhB (NUDIX family)